MKNTPRNRTELLGVIGKPLLVLSYWYHMIDGKAVKHESLLYNVTIDAVCSKHVRLKHDNPEQKGKGTFNVPFSYFLSSLQLGNQYRLA